MFEFLVGYFLGVTASRPRCVTRSEAPAEKDSYANINPLTRLILLLLILEVALYFLLPDLSELGACYGRYCYDTARESYEFLLHFLCWATVALIVIRVFVQGLDKK